MIIFIKRLISRVFYPKGTFMGSRCSSYPDGKECGGCSDCTPVVRVSVEESMDRIREEIKKDDGYALCWHCNIAVELTDNGVSYDEAQKSAGNLMYRSFGRDTYTLFRAHHEYQV